MRSWRRMRVGAKQRHTAKRIFERLCDGHGYAGGITIVKDYVRAQRLRHCEVFVPLRHDPGHAQVDFGEAPASARSTSLRWTCRTAMPVSSGPIRRKPPKRSATALAAAPGQPDNSTGRNRWFV